jgi:hypothetical protein
MCYRWEKTHGLLIEGGLTYEAIKKSVADASIAFRDGVVELFEFLEVRFGYSLSNFSRTCLESPNFIKRFGLVWCGSVRFGFATD